MAIGVLLDVGKSFTSLVGSVASLDFDVTADEVHEWTADITTSPVEVGAPVADHIQLQPDRLTLTGWITDAPISPDLQARFSGGIDGAITMQRAQTAFDLLRSLYEKRELIVVYTRHKIYVDMAIASINIPRNAEVGEAVKFTVQLVHVRLVNTQTVDVPPGISAKKTKKVAGVQKKSSATKKGGAVQNKKTEVHGSFLNDFIFGNPVDRVRGGQ